MKQTVVSRRQFLRAGVLTSSLFALSTHAQEAPRPFNKYSSQIIDTHLHFYNPTRQEGVPWPGPDDPLLYRKTMPEDFQNIALQNGVTGAIVVEASPWLEDNQWILDLAAETPWILGVVGNLKTGDPEFAINLKRFCASHLFKGLRINTPFPRQGGVPRFLDDLRLIANAGLTMDVNGDAAGYQDILEVKRKIPDLRIVVEHLPRRFSPHADESKREEDALAELGSLPGIYAKVSAVLDPADPAPSLELEDYRPVLDDIWRIFGADKVIYGSNWPVSNRVAPYATVIDLMKKYLAEKSPQDSELYFFKNAEIAYQLTS
ncbi:amidohydrolase family protein [Planctomicrobium sp. SH661]|uniref:amidohydrolase family protein n=1 Tax=Planctomicrobium sp. SH661 TaxID=3448124 RepID=UPI003F5C892C